MKNYYVYILASKKNGVLYIGVTGDLIKRVWQHKNNFAESFTKKYHTHRLVYFESSENVETAIQREKQLKNWHREWKINLIETRNPQWLDLYDEITK